MTFSADQFTSFLDKKTSPKPEIGEDFASFLDSKVASEEPSISKPATSRQEAYVPGSIIGNRTGYMKSRVVSPPLPHEPHHWDDWKKVEAQREQDSLTSAKTPIETKVPAEPKPDAELTPYGVPWDDLNWAQKTALVRRSEGRDHPLTPTPPSAGEYVRYGLQKAKTGLTAPAKLLERMDVAGPGTRFLAQKHDQLAAQTKNMKPRSQVSPVYSVSESISEAIEPRRDQYDPRKVKRTLRGGAAASLARAPLAAVGGMAGTVAAMENGGVGEILKQSGLTPNFANPNEMTVKRLPSELSDRDVQTILAKALEKNGQDQELRISGQIPSRIGPPVVDGAKSFTNLSRAANRARNSSELRPSDDLDLFSFQGLAETIPEVLGTMAIATGMGGGTGQFGLTMGMIDAGSGWEQRAAELESRGMDSETARRKASAETLQYLPASMLLESLSMEGIAKRSGVVKRLLEGAKHEVPTEVLQGNAQDLIRYLSTGDERDLEEIGQHALENAFVASVIGPAYRGMFGQGPARKPMDIQQDAVNQLKKMGIDVEPQARRESVPIGGNSLPEGQTVEELLQTKNTGQASSSVISDATADDRKNQVAEQVPTAEERAAVDSNDQQPAEAESSEGQQGPETASVLEDNAKHPVIEVPIAELSLSKDVPNFKEDADLDTGVVRGQQLEGSYNRLGTGNIVVWERADGTKEVITGRHRFDLARRAGERTIPAQIVRETEGFGVQDALTLDAELNILDGQGTVKDYANYFRHTQITKEQARSRGLLSRAKGNSGWALGKDATDNLFDQFRNGGISEGRAVAIAKAAPGNERLQNAGIDYTLRNPKAAPDEIGGFITALGTQGGRRTAPTGDQGDLFGLDDDGMREAELLAKAVSSIQRDLKNQISAVSGAARRPEAAKKLGVDVRDPEAVNKKIKSLRESLEKWDHWATNPELVDQARAWAGLNPIDRTEARESNIFKSRQEQIEKQPPNVQQGDMLGGKSLTDAAPDVGTPSVQGKIGKSDAPKNVPDMFESGPEKSLGTALGTMSLEDRRKGKALSAASIIKEVEQVLGIPIRGKGTHRKGAAVGFYKIREQVIRNLQHNDLEATSHEMAHHLERVIWGNVIGRKHFRPFQKELADLDYDQSKRRTHEGFAEYMRHWLMEDDAEQVAPKFHEYFQNEVLNQHPELKKKLGHIKKLYQEWMDQGAVNRVLGNIEGEGDRSVKPPAKYRLADGLRTIRKWFQESTAPLNYMMRASGIKESEVNPKANPVSLIERYKMKAPSMAYDAVRNGWRNDEGRIVSPGLREILSPVSEKGKEAIRDFMAYAYARRGLFLHGKGINPGITSRDARYIVEQAQANHPEWSGISDQLTEWSDHLIQLLVDAGGLSEDVAQSIRDANPIYVPLKRVFVDEINIRPGKKRGYVNQPRGIKKIRGSGRQVKNIFDSMAEQAAEIIGLANKVRVARALADLAERNTGFGRWVEKVPPPLEAQRVNTREVLDSLVKTGVLSGDTEINVRDLPEVLTFFSNANYYKGKDNIVAIWRNGKREFYELHPDIYRAMTDMDTVQLHWLAEWMLAKPTRLVRLGATALRPGFAAFNFIRDMLTMTMNSDTSNIGLVRSLQGLKMILTKDAWHDLYKANVGGQMGFVSQDRRMLRAVRDRMLASTPKRKAVYVVKHPIEVLRDVIGVAESASRLKEFQLAYEAAKKKYSDPEDIMIEAVNAAQDVTINFTRSGSYGRILNQVFPFWNAAVQSVEKTGRTALKNPGRTAWRGVSYLTLPTIALWLLNRDEEWYRELASWEKSAYWHFRAGGTDEKPKVIRIPKPFEWGYIFAALPELAIDSVYDEDPDLFSDGMKSMGLNLLPEMNPMNIGAIRPVSEVYRNRNFADQPIVPMRMSRIPPEQQYNDWTPAIYKAVGRLLEQSPLQIQHIAEGYTGGLTRAASSSINAGLDLAEKEKAVNLADLPVVGRFFARKPEFPSRSAERFYDRLDELTMKDKRNTATAAELAELTRLEHISRNLSKIRKAIRESDDDVEKDQLTRIMRDTLQVALGRKPTNKDISSVR